MCTFICQNKAEESRQVTRENDGVQIPVAIQNGPKNLNVARTEIVKDSTTVSNAVSESGIQLNDVNAVEGDNVTEEAVALNGGGIQNIAVNNLIDDNSNGTQESISKRGISGTSTIKGIDPKALVENAVVLIGNGVADAPFVADDVTDENSIENNVKKSYIITGNGQFGKNIQARATYDAIEKSNNSVSTEENENVKVVKAFNFHFQSKPENINGEKKLVSINVALKNKTRNIIFQFPINIYVDNVDKKSGFITRLKKKSSSTVSDVFLANKVKELLKKSKDEEGKINKNNSITQELENPLRNK